MKKWLLIIVVISAPLLAALLSFVTVRTAYVEYQIVAPRIVTMTEATLAQLDVKTLSALSAGAYKNQKMIVELWGWAQTRYEMLVYVLLGLVFALSTALTLILWRLPSNLALNTDAVRPQRAG